MKKSLRLLATLVACTSAFALSGCGSKDSAGDKGAGDEKSEREKIKGNVVYGIPDWQAETGEKLAEGFMKEYPNVTVEVIPFTGDVNTFLSTQAATGDMPDVVKGFQEIIYPISQGWIAPLNKFVNEDEEFKYVDEDIINSFVHNGNLFALPMELTLSGVFVNLDLLESLNIDKPDYDWTTEEFLDIARKCTTSTNSGLSSWSEYYREGVGQFTKNGAEYLYDPVKGGYDFTSSGFQKAFDFIKEIDSVPGLNAATLRNQALKDEGKLDDYQKKFGEQGDGFLDGKIAFFARGLWNLDSFNFNFKYDFYPMPSDPSVGYKQGIHIDHAFMTTMVKEENEQAAFEFLKWITYSSEGTLNRFEIRAELEDPKPRAFLPATTHPDVIKEFNKIETIPEGVKFMYENLDKSVRVDLYKVVPGMNTALNEVIWPTFMEIKEGKTEASSIGAQLEKRANEILKEANDNLEKEIAGIEEYKNQPALK